MPVEEASSRATVSFPDAACPWMKTTIIVKS
jgi:hypothetical protein